MYSLISFYTTSIQALLAAPTASSYCSLQRHNARGKAEGIAMCIDNAVSGAQRGVRSVVGRSTMEPVRTYDGRKEGKERWGGGGGRTRVSSISRKHKKKTLLVYLTTSKYMQINHNRCTHHATILGLRTVPQYQ